MPHISKQRIQIDVYRQIQKQLIRVLSDLSRDESKNVFVSELLTYTERIMLAKRLAVLLMLKRGNTMYEIAQKLKVSSSTVARLENAMDRGKFKSLLSQVKKGNIEKFLEELITFIAIPLTTP